MRSLCIMLALALLTTLAPLASSDPYAERTIYTPRAAEDVALDANGNVYVTGFDSGPYGADAYVRKYTASGDLAWGTWIAGTEVDIGQAITVDGSGNVFVGGHTSSDDLLAGGWKQTNAGDSDGFVAKLSPSGAIQWISYLGGSSHDEVTAIDWAASDTVVVVGTTYSCDFPTYGSPWQGQRGGDCAQFRGDAFVTKFVAGGASAVFSTYLGGAEQDEATGVAVSRSTSSILLAGWTGSTNFPTNSGAMQRAYAGNGDAFVTKLTPTGALQYSTYYGGSDVDRAVGIVRDGSGNPVLAGNTKSTDLRVSSDAFQTSFGGGRQCSHWEGGPSPVWVEEVCMDVFVAKLASDLSGLRWGSYVGTDKVERAVDIAIDPRGAVFVTGDTNATKFPLVDDTTTNVYEVRCDVFALAVVPEGRALAYSTTFGGPICDTATGVAVDGTGAAWYAGWSAGEAGGWLVKIGRPTENVVMDHRGGNEWWVEGYVGGRDGGKVVKLEARDQDSPYVALTKQPWGFYAGVLHVEPGNAVFYRATTSDGRVFESCGWSHPAATGCGEPAPPSTFDATFTNVKGNEWWIEAKVTANKPLISVEASVNGGAWKAMTFRSWGAYAVSLHAPEGSIVQLRATSNTGQTDLSQCYRWLAATLTTCGGGGGGGSTFDATFANARGNEWWVEVDVTATGGTLATVDARVNGSAWVALTKQSWGSWAKSIHVAPGSTVEFRATSTTGATDVSGANAWPP